MSDVVIHNEMQGTYTLYISPIIGEVKVGDIVSVYIDTENRGQSSISLYGNDLFTSIDVNINGTNEVISKIKIFHYVNSTHGFLINMNYESKNFVINPGNNNLNSLIELDVSGLIPYYEPEPEPEPEPEIEPEIEPEPEPEPEPENEIISYNMETVFGETITFSSIPYTMILYPISGNIKENDVIVVFVGNENRSPISRVKKHPQYPDTLFASVNINTQGTESNPEEISVIKVFHFINEMEGYVSEIQNISNSFNKLIQGSTNISSPIPLDVP